MTTVPDRQPIAFVAMPFGGVFDKVFDQFIRPTLSEAGLLARRADRISSSANIVDDIVEHLVTSVIVVADLTGNNPNVCYELGIAHALKKPTIQLTQDLSALHFNIRDYRAIGYKPTPAGYREARQTLLDLALKWNVDSGAFRNPVTDFLNGSHSSAIEPDGVLLPPALPDANQRALLISEQVRTLEFTFRTLNDVYEIPRLLESASGPESEATYSEALQLKNQRVEAMMVRQCDNLDMQMDYMETVYGHLKANYRLVTGGEDEKRMLSTVMLLPTITEAVEQCLVFLRRGAAEMRTDANRLQDESVEAAGFLRLMAGYSERQAVSLERAVQLSRETYNELREA